MANNLVFNIIIIIMCIIIAFLFIASKKKKATKKIEGRASLSQQSENSLLMQELGHATERAEELLDQVKTFEKEEDIILNVNKSVRKSIINEKKEILKSGVLLYPITMIDERGDYSVPTLYNVIGEDGIDFGKCLGIITNPNSYKAWIWYSKGEGRNLEKDIIGGKTFNEVIKKIDKKSKNIFIRYRTEDEHIPEDFTAY